MIQQLSMDVTLKENNMKVRCINESNSWVNCDTMRGTQEGPKYGEICTVVGDITPGGYDLEEYPCPDSYGWAKYNFESLPGMGIRIERVAVEPDLVKEIMELDEVRNWN